MSSTFDCEMAVFPLNSRVNKGNFVNTLGLDVACWYPFGLLRILHIGSYILERLFGKLAHQGLALSYLLEDIEGSRRGPGF